MHKARKFPIEVIKVKAHATSADVVAGYPEPWKEGNSYADAAAKQGRSMHPVDVAKTEEARRVLVTTTLVAKFLVRVNIAALDAADDVPPFDRKDLTKKIVDRSRPYVAPKHAIVPDGKSFRCLWCLKTSASSSRIRGDCLHAPGHLLWKAGDVTICTLCGGYADRQAVLLAKGCRGHVNKRGKHNLKRVFDLHLHPVQDLSVPAASYWRSAACSQEHRDPSALLLADALGEFFVNLKAGDGEDAATEVSAVQQDQFDAIGAPGPLEVRHPCGGEGQVFDNAIFDFSEDAMQVDGGEPIPTSITCASNVAIAADLDLDEHIRRACYAKTEADNKKYSDAVSGTEVGSSSLASSSSQVWTSAGTAPNRFADVIIRESSRIRGRFTFPGDRGLSSSLFGLDKTLPCTDDLLGRGVIDGGNSDTAFDHDHFFGLECTDSSSAAASRPRPHSEEVLPPQKRFRLNFKQAVPAIRPLS